MYVCVYVHPKLNVSGLPQLECISFLPNLDVSCLSKSEYTYRIQTWKYLVFRKWNAFAGIHKCMSGFLHSDTKITYLSLVTV